MFRCHCLRIQWCLFQFDDTSFASLIYVVLRVLDARGARSLVLGLTLKPRTEVLFGVCLQVGRGVLRLLFLDSEEVS